MHVPELTALRRFTALCARVGAILRIAMAEFRLHEIVVDVKWKTTSQTSLHSTMPGRGARLGCSAIEILGI